MDYTVLVEEDRRSSVSRLLSASGSQVQIPNATLASADHKAPGVKSVLRPPRARTHNSPLRPRITEFVETFSTLGAAPLLQHPPS